MERYWDLVALKTLRVNPKQEKFHSMAQNFYLVAQKYHLVAQNFHPFNISIPFRSAKMNRRQTPKKFAILRHQ